MAEISLPHLRHNARVLQRRASGADVLAVVKANAFGHGAVAVARALRAEGVRHFGVARVPEGIALRAAGLDGRILCFEAPLPEHLPAYIAHRIDATVPSAAGAAVAAARTHGPLRVHLKIETGMGRLGVTPEEAPAVAKRLAEAPGVTLAGVWTHLATAGEAASEAGRAFVREQMARFGEALGRIRDTLGGALTPGCRVHAANSSALIAFPEESVRAFQPTFARAGIALYGLADTEALAEDAGLRPAMRLVSRVTHIKTVEAGTSISYGRTWRAPRRTRIATVGAGYGDGYHRILSNRAEVGIGGARFPVVGAVCMDLLMADLGPPGSAPGRRVEVGDEVVLFGAGGPSAFEVARWAETIAYEVCCAVAARVPRRYAEAETP